MSHRQQLSPRQGRPRFVLPGLALLGTLALIAALLGGSQRTSAVGPELTVDAPAAVEQGEVFTIDINLAEIADLRAFNIQLDWDPAAFTFMSTPVNIKTGVFSAATKVNDFSAYNVVPGKAIILASSETAAAGLLTGLLVRIEFKTAIDAPTGSTNFTIGPFGTEGLLKDSNGNEISVATTGDTLTVNLSTGGGNTAPTITNVGDQTITQGTSTNVLGFIVADAQDAAGTLIITRTSSNTPLVPTANVVLGGSGAARTVQVTPVAGQTGMTTITLRVTDNDASPKFLETTFTVTVNAGGGGGGSGCPNGSAVVVCVNAPATVAPNGTFTADVRIENVVDLNAYSVLLTFDASVLTVTGLSDPTNTGILFDGVATPVNGNFTGFGPTDVEIIVFADKDPSKDDGADGDGILLSVNFKVAASAPAGATPLTLQPFGGGSPILNSDGGGIAAQFISGSVTIGSGGTNTKPTITAPANFSTTPGTTASRNFTVTDTEDNDGTLSVTVVSSTNTPLLPPANVVVLGSSGSTRTVTVTPVSGQTGTATITLRVTDNGSPTLTDTDTFTVTVSSGGGGGGGGGGGNTAPTISSIADQTTGPGTPTAQIPFTVGDTQTATANLVVTGSSNNQSVVANGNILLGGTGANRTLIILPVAFGTGSATITLTVTDAGGLTATTSFVLSIGGAPTINVPSDQTIAQDTSTGSLPFIVSDSITPAANLIVTATSSNSTLVPAANILFGGSGTLRTVLVSPTSGRTGTVTITLTVEDGDGLTASGSFLLTVTADTTPAGGDTFPMILVQGFNLITFTGPDGATPRQFAELIGTGRVGGIFRFNGVSQSFDSFFLSAPTFVNSLFNLTSRDPLFVLITPGPQIVLELPALTNPDPNRVVSLFNGWTLVGYTGLVTAIDELFFRVTTSVAGVFSFDAFTQLYRANFPNPNTPSFVDQFTIVGPLDVLYILSERPVPAALTFPETGLPIAVAGR